MSTIRLGTRRSALATPQSTWVADRLRAAGHDVELVLVTTDGDRDQRTALRQLGGTGVFVSALRSALHEGRIDAAVHSLKDLPTAPAEGLALGAIPVREDPRDALVARDGMTLGELPPGAVIGTGSPRRQAQLLALGLGHRVSDLRGNVDTRLAAVTRVGSTESSSPWPACAGSGATTRSPRSSTRSRCCPPPARVLSPSRSGLTTGPCVRPWLRSTTPTPARA